MSFLLLYCFTLKSRVTANHVLIRHLLLSHLTFMLILCTMYSVFLLQPATPMSFSRTASSVERYGLVGKGETKQDDGDALTRERSLVVCYLSVSLHIACKMYLEMTSPISIQYDQMKCSLSTRIFFS